MSRVTGFAVVLLGGFAGWMTRPLSSIHALSTSSQTRPSIIIPLIHSPPVVVESQEHEPPAEPARCDLQRRLRVSKRYRELAEGPFADSIIAPVLWNDVETRPEERPRRAETRIVAWAARCLESDAWLSIRCEEYPCAFAFERESVVDSGCLRERWSGLDRDWDPGADSHLAMRYVLDASSEDSLPAGVSRRRTPRSNFFVADHVHELNRRLQLRSR